MYRSKILLTSFLTLFSSMRGSSPCQTQQERYDPYILQLLPKCTGLLHVEVGGKSKIERKEGGKPSVE